MTLVLLELTKHTYCIVVDQSGSDNEMEYQLLLILLLYFCELNKVQALNIKIQVYLISVYESGKLNNT